MAVANVFSEYLVKNNMEFEMFFKSYLNDKLNLECLDDNTKDGLRRLTNSLRYWNDSLMKQESSRTIIFTTFAPGLASSVSQLDIFKALQKIIDLNCISEIYLPENRRYIGLSFNDEVSANLVKSSFKKVENSYVVFMSWMSEAKLYTGRLHWLPVAADIISVKSLLSKYFIVESCVKIRKHVLDKIFITTNVVEFTGVVKKGVHIDMVPYLFDLDKNKILLTIKGRKPICLNCKSVGHVKSECDYSYCRKCGSNVLKSHSCQVLEDNCSYASVVGEKGLNKVILEKEIRGKESASDDIVSEETDSQLWMQVNKENSRSYSKSENMSEQGKKNIHTTEEDWLVVKRNPHIPYSIKRNTSGNTVEGIASDNQNISKDENN